MTSRTARNIHHGFGTAIIPESSANGEVIHKRASNAGFEFFGMILLKILLSACRLQVEYVNWRCKWMPSLFSRVGVAGRCPRHPGLAFLLGLSLEADPIIDLWLEATRFHPPSRWRIPEWERTFHR